MDYITVGLHIDACIINAVACQLRGKRVYLFT